MSTRRKVAPIWAWVLLLVALCGGGLALYLGVLNRHQPWNVVLVTFDTTRADKLESYGNTRIKTPTLDRLAAQGYQFANAMTAAPITGPSHSTILTGLYPLAHGFRDNGLFKLSDEQLTLPEILHQHGYATAGAVGAYPVIGRFGFGQGFDLFDDHLTGQFEDYLGQRVIPKTRMFFDERRAAQVNEAVIPWLTRHAANPFFLWVHYFDPHQPFEPPPPYDQLYADDPYSGEVAYADAQLGRLLKRLDKLGVLNRTLVVMVADHGEGRGEHNEITHAVLAYDSTLHVPLIIRPPPGSGATGKIIEQRVATVDIVPTVLDLLGIDRPKRLQGRSLVPLMQGKPAEEPEYYAENLSPKLTHDWGELRVLFEGRYKYIHGPRSELYDLETDPKELHDLASTMPGEVKRMREDLGQFMFDHTVGVSTTAAADDDVVQRLRSLGYLQGPTSGGETISETLKEGGTAPQDRVSDLNDMSAAKQLLFDGRYADALVYTTKLIARSPESRAYIALHVSALATTGHLQDAWKMLQSQVADDDTVSESLVLSLVAKQFDAGKRKAALEYLTGYAETSKSQRAHWLLALLQERLGDGTKARAELEKALAIDPNFAPARVDLAVHFAKTGTPRAAEQEFQKVLQKTPYYPKATYNYGTFLFNEGRVAEAMAYFRRTLDLAPSYARARLALITAQMAAGDRSGAETSAKELRSVAPHSAEAEQADVLLAAH